jgi:acylphosphatase
MASLHAVVHGDVQGVGFRYFVQRRAQETGLAGWVRNLPDGSVEIQAEGERAALERFLEQVSRGPGLAAVERVDAEWDGGGGRLRGFTIRQ